MAHPKHELVRCKFKFSCGYCCVSEIDAGGELAVDHFTPVSAGGDDGEDNLVYACFRCNSYKADFLPNAIDLENGHRVLHPLLEDVSAHVRENLESGFLEPLTETGRFHIFLLRLNRPQLIDYRKRKRLEVLLTESHRLLEEENSLLKHRLANLENYVVHLRARKDSEGDK